jgi:hypothetical protein
MPFAATAISMLVLLTLTPPSLSTSCMTKDEARQHFGSVRLYLHGHDRCWDAVPAREVIQADKAQGTADQPGQAPPAAPADNLGEMRWIDRWEDIDGSDYPELARWIEAVQAASPMIERKAEPMFTPSGVVLVAIVLVLTLATIEVLFRCTIS